MGKKIIYIIIFRMERDDKREFAMRERWIG